MAQNTVTVLLKVRDEITSAVSGIKSQLAGIATSTKGIDSAMGGVQAAVFGAGVQMTLFEVAINSAAQAASVLKNQLLEASKIQTEMTVAGGTIGSNMGIGLEGGIKLLKETRLELGKVADSLPGVATDYTSTGNAVMPQLAKLGYSEAELKKLTVTIATGGGFMGATTGMGSSAGINMAKLLGGSTAIKELMANDVFERYAGDAKGKIAESLKTAGVKEEDWKTISPQQRAKIVADFASKIATPELAAALSMGLDSKLATLTSAVFDPERGILGFLKPIADRGSRSGLDAVTELFDTLSKLASSLGGGSLDLDGAMRAVIDTVDFFTRLGLAAIGVLNGGESAFGDIVNNFFTGAITWVNSMVASVGNAIRSYPWAQVGFFLGQALANLFLAVQDINWWEVLITLLDVVNGLLLGIIGALAGLIYTIFVGTAQKIAKRFGWVADLVMGVVGVIGDAIDGWGAAFQAMWSASLTAIKPIVDFFVNGFQAMWSAALTAIQPIVDFFVNGFQATVGQIKATAEAIADPGKAIQNTAKAAVTNPVGALSNVSKVAEVAGVISNPSKAIQNTAKAAVTNPVGALSNFSKVAEVAGVISNPMQSIVDFSNRAVKGVFGGGDKPKELPTVNNLQSNAGGTFSPVINLQANANMSTGDQVDMLLSAINDRYREYQQGVIA